MSSGMKRLHVINLLAAGLVTAILLASEFPTRAQLPPGPDLVLTKDDGGVTVTPGQTITYTLTYTSTGVISVSATGVVITETVPANTSLNQAGSNPAWVCVPNGNAGSTCTLEVGYVAPGQGGSRDFAVDVDPTLPAGTNVISNTAQIGDNGANGPDPNPGDNTAGSSTPVDAAPDLTLTKDGSLLPATVGQTTTYTMTVTNAGDQDATGVVVTDTVPAHTTFSQGSSSPGWSLPDRAPAGSVGTLAVGPLGAGITVTLDFAVDLDTTLPAGTSVITNTAQVGDDGANGSDPNPGNNAGSGSVPVKAGPDLTLTKSDGGLEVRTGETVTYTLTFANTGDQGATGVVITDTVPSNTTFNQGSSSPGWSLPDRAPAGSVGTLAVGPLGATITRTVDFAVDVNRVLPAGINAITNTAQIGDDGTKGPDPNPDGNSSSVSTSVAVAPAPTPVLTTAGFVLLLGLFVWIAAMGLRHRSASRAARK